MAEEIVFYCKDYWDFSFGRFHPMRPLRVKLAIELMRDMGLLEGVEVKEPNEAPHQELLTYHSADYLDALEKEEEAPQYGLGVEDNPVVPGIFRFASIGTGGTIAAAKAVMKSDAIVFNPGGGMHHAKPNRAFGFCYLNDVVIALKILADAGLKVFYLDIDAHHCDAVQEAFYEDSRVFVCSLHQEDAFPLTGKLEELGDKEGKGYNVNIPLPRYTEDEEVLFIFEELVVPLIERYAPDVLFLQAGADGHKDDPLTSLYLTTGIYDRIGRILRDLNLKRIIITGGGGYDMVNVARIWTILWGRLTGKDFPDRLPERFLRISIMEGYDGPDIWDTPGWSGDKAHIKPVLRERVNFLKREVGL